MVLQGSRPTIPPGCPPKFKELIELCWNADAARRPPFSKVLETLSSFLKDTTEFEQLQTLPQGMIIIVFLVFILLFFPSPSSLSPSASLLQQQL
jgi:hypothetical protein